MSHRNVKQLPLSLVQALEEEYDALEEPIPAAERAWTLQEDDLLKPYAFLKRIGAARGRNGTDLVTERIRDRLGPPLCRTIDDWLDGGLGGPPTGLLLDGLNAIIRSPDNLYDPDAFQGVALSDWVCQLADLMLEHADDQQQRNRLLLHEAYPELIRTRLARLYTRIHAQAPERSALALSGGGIRSATFGLGLVQGLARHGLIDRFDYLSTVSGGGYIGGWLSAWMQHHPRELTGVAEALAENPIKPLEPEPPPLHHLRSYSNYLTPKLGVMSADTWSLIAIGLRNILLNWAVLLPLFVGVLALPRLLVSAGHWPMPAEDAVVGVQWTAFLVLLWAVGFAGWNLSGGRRVASRAGAPPGKVSGSAHEGAVLLFCVLPTVLAALAFTLSWAWFMRLGRGLNQPATFRLVIAAGIVCAAVGLSAYGARLWRLSGFALGEFLRRLPRAATRTRSSATEVADLLISLIVIAAGTVIAAAVLTKMLLPLRFVDGKGGLNMGLYFTVTPPVLFGLLALASSFFVGMSSRWMADDTREWLGRSTAWLLIAGLAWLALCVLVIYGPEWLLRWHPIARAIAGIVGTASGLFTVLVGRSASTSGPNQPQRADPRTMLLNNAVQITSLLFMAALAVALSLATSLVLQAILADRSSWSDLRIASARLPHDVFVQRAIVERLSLRVAALLVALPLAICLAVSHYIDVNKFSLHSTYRNRLTRAYLGASRPTRTPNWFTGFDDEDDLPMHTLWPVKHGASAAGVPERKKLLHVVSATLNLVSGSNLAWQERKAESFTISALHCGGFHLGYRESKRYGDRHGITLGAAMAISGAAASPNMGYHSSTVVSFVMTIFNARLGAWMANPGVPGQGKVHKTPTQWSIGPLIREAFGLTTDRNSYVYLSDGGHFENLGLYEMVLRRCRYIVVSDATGDPNYQFTDLGNAVRKIRIDLGVPIVFTDEIAIGRDGTKYNGSYCAIGSIRYSHVDGASANDGVLIYIKPAIIRGEPRDVLDYAASSITFPQETTADQFFSESQFEAYRALGAHIVDKICDAFPGPPGFETLAQGAQRHAEAVSARRNGSLPDFP